MHNLLGGEISMTMVQCMMDTTVVRYHNITLYNATTITKYYWGTLYGATIAISHNGALYNATIITRYHWGTLYDATIFPKVNTVQCSQ